MRKISVLAVLMLSLLTLTPLMPAVVQATAYNWYWDDVLFVKGQLPSGTHIKYPHPDRDWYGISPYVTWYKEGVKLEHNQLDHDASEMVKIGIVAVCGIIGAAVGLQLSGHQYGALAGAAIGIFLGAFVSGSAEVIKDEVGCVWWWLSISFVDWVKANMWWLGPLVNLHPATFLTVVTSAFLLYGYLRIGPITFYDAIGAGNPAYSLTISASGDGTTNLPPGTYTCGYGEAVTVTAIPDENRFLDHWMLDGHTYIVGYENPVTITMNRNHTLTAFFYFMGGGGCPILSVYDGEEYVEEGSLNIHAPEGEDTIVSHVLTVEPEPEGWLYLLRLTEPDLPDSHSFIDQVKLLAVDESGSTEELQLISAVHSEYGQVLPKLLFSDDTRTDTLPYQTIDLKFLAPIWESEILIFIIEGYNTKRPL